MKFFEAISLAEANRIINETMANVTVDVEMIDIMQANGRVLAEDIYAEDPIPPFVKSTVDGYAILARDSQGANDAIPSYFQLNEDGKIGEKPEYSLTSGWAAYVPTGGMLPVGADGVVMVEHCQRLESGELFVYKPIHYGENTIQIGEDIAPSTLAISANTRLHAGHIGVLASLSRDYIQAYQKPSFTIISTGDELVPFSEKLTIGKIRDVNTFTLNALVQNYDGVVDHRQLVPDHMDELQAAISKAVDRSSIVLISGGSSVGNKDYTYQIISELPNTQLLLHGLAIKPGKPTLVARSENSLVVGLPGHPVSAMMVFEALMVPYMMDKYRICPVVKTVMAEITQDIHSSPGKRNYQMVQLIKENGKHYAKPHFGKSGMITTLAHADGYIIINADEEGIYQGMSREVFLF